jgi:hypothetical protein
MTLDALKRKLIAAARAQRPSESVPFGFERRVMNRLLAATVPDASLLWARGLWRAAAGCVGLVLLLGTLTLFVLHTATPAEDLSQAFENTLLAGVNQDMEQ